MDGGASYSAMLFAEAWELGLARPLLRPVRHRGPAADAGQQWRRAYCSRKDRGTGAGSPPPFRGQAVHQIQMGIPSRDRSGWSSTCACAVVVLEEKCGGHAARGMEPNRRARGARPADRLAVARRRPPTGLAGWGLVWFGDTRSTSTCTGPCYSTPLQTVPVCVHLELMVVAGLAARSES